MNIKAFFVAASALILSATAVSAQTNGKAPKDRNNKTAPAPDGRFCRPDSAACPFSNLNLTDAQKTKLQELDTKMQNNRNECREQQRARRADSRKEYLAGLKNILTPAQYTEFLENSFISKDMRHHRVNNHNGRHGNHRHDRMHYGKRGDRPARPQTDAANK